MKTVYEWCVESVDEFGDIIDVDFRDRLSDFKVVEGDLCLVRRSGNDKDGEQVRYYAYVNNSVLPDVFEGSDIAVPERFKKELEEYLGN